MIAVAYQKLSLMRGINYKALTGKLWRLTVQAQSTLAFPAGISRAL